MYDYEPGWEDEDEYWDIDEGSSWYDEEDEYLESQDPCDNCGPWCEHWGGDGLCLLAIEQQQKEWEKFEREFYSIQRCPVCGKTLEQWEIPVNKLWVFPGEFNPMIGLSIYGAYDIPKSIIHIDRNVYHIWVGQKYNQKLIKLQEQP